jgi:hypothetical protein
MYFTSKHYEFKKIHLYINNLDFFRAINVM